MKKIAYTLMALCLISACSEQKEPEQGIHGRQRPAK